MSERGPAPEDDSPAGADPALESGTLNSSSSDGFASAASHAAYPLFTATMEATGPPTEHAPAERAPGIRIGRYELRDELGRGGMGVVYSARDPELGREVALKVVRAGQDANDSQRRRFSREARAVARLKHPNIVEVYDMGTYEGGLYYTMEYVAGTSLARRIAGVPVEPRVAARLAMGIAHALACAHDAGLIHRDVKPGNVLLDGDTPKLTDFGLVKQLDSDEATAVLTRGDQMLGTPAYMAPEQLAGDNDAVVPATDQYALGIILFEMLAGQRPFKGVGSNELVHRMTASEPPRLPLAGTPRELDFIRRRAMAFAPDERYASCTEMADDLQRFLDGAPVRASAPGLVRRARWLWRRYWRRAVVAALVVGAVFGGVQLRAAWSDWQRARAEERRQAAAETMRVSMEQRVAGLLKVKNTADADVLFDKFADFEGNRGTRALASAQLHHGQRLRARNLAEPAPDTAKDAFDALAQAYAGSDDADLQGRALMEMAEEFRAQYRWSELQVVLDTMRARVPAALSHPRMDRTRLDSALARRDLDRAVALAEPSWLRDGASVAPLLSHLARATATGHRAEVAQLWDMDGDQRPELVLGERGTKVELLVVGLENASLPVRHRAPLPSGYEFHSRFFPLQPASPPTLIMESAPRLLLATPDGDTQPATSVDYSPLGPGSRAIHNVVSVDLDGEGTVEHFVAMGMDLVQLVQKADGTWSILVHDEVNSTSALVTGMVASDLDGDGHIELVIGTNGWQRYDVQVFQAAAVNPDSRANGTGIDGHYVPLRQVSRMQFGAVAQLAVVDTPEERLLAVLQLHDPARPLNHRIFPADTPQGRARGIHLVPFAGEQLQRPRTVIPLPRIDDERSQTRDDQWEHLTHLPFFTADLDADGRDELILGAEEHGIFIYRREPEGRFRELAISDTEFLALAQLDDDPMPEMVVSLPERDIAVWVLGAGSERLPTILAEAPVASHPDTAEQPRGPVIRRELSARWQRAEDLHDIGLSLAASNQLREIAKLAVGSVDEGRALYRSGQIFAEIGEFDEAGSVFAQAAASAEVAPSAWEAAMDAHLADMRWQAAKDAADQRLALPSAPVRVRESADELRAHLDAPIVRFDFRSALPEAWRIRSPLQVRSDHQGRGVRLVADSTAPLMTIPLRRTGGPVRFAIDFIIERLDWASFLEVYVGDGNDSHELFRMHYRGGGNVYELEVSCYGVETHVIENPAQLLGQPVRLVWEQAEDGRYSCELATDGTADRRQVYLKSPWVAFDQSTEMLFVSRSLRYPATAQVLVQSIELTGFTTRSDDEPTPLQRAHRELARGRPEAALPHLDAAVAAEPAMGNDPAWQLARAIVAEELGDQATTLSMLQRALATDGALRGHIRALFRDHLDRFEVPLRTLLGDQYYVLFADTVLLTAVTHRREGRMLALVRDHLDGLEDVPLYLDQSANARIDRDTAAAYRIDLQVWRGRVWRLAGRLSLAIRTLRAARGLAHELRARGEALAPRIRREAENLLYSAGQELALCYLARGESNRAMDALLVLLAEAPAPEIVADAIVARGEFKALRQHPRWRLVERVRTSHTVDSAVAALNVARRASEQTASRAAE